MRMDRGFLGLCTYQDLYMTNTFFATKLSHRVSCWHPRSCHCHLLDLIITQRPLLNYILVTHSYHSANCDTDHSLVASNVHLQPKQIHQSKQKGHPCINTAMTSMPDLCEHLTDFIEAALNDCHTGKVEERWNHICDAIYNSAMDTFGKREAEPRLVWRRDFWTRASDYSQESSTGWVLEGPLREVTSCTQESQEWCPTDCSMLHQWILAEPLSGYSILCWLQQCLCYVWWHEESLWSKHHQDHTPQVHHWWHYHRLMQTDGEMVRTLQGTLLKGKYCHWLSWWEYPHLAYLGRAWHSTLSRGTEQGHQHSCLWQRSRKRWHPTRSHQGWQADCPSPPPPWASATLLGRGDCALRYAQC